MCRKHHFGWPCLQWFWLVGPNPYIICPAFPSFYPLKSQGGHNGDFQGPFCLNTIVLFITWEEQSWSYPDLWDYSKFSTIFGSGPLTCLHDVLFWVPRGYINYWGIPSYCSYLPIFLTAFYQVPLFLCIHLALFLIFSPTQTLVQQHRLIFLSNILLIFQD
jgi:hypothetical protein